jgi:hypothetical protein
MLDFLMRFFLASNLNLDTGNPNVKIKNFYDSFSNLRSFIVNLLQIIEPSRFQITTEIERTTLNKIMFKCGSIYCFEKKKILEKNENIIYFRTKLPFTYVEFNQKNDKSLALVKGILSEIF